MAIAMVGEDSVEERVAGAVAYADYADSERAEYCGEATGGRSGVAVLSLSV